MVVRRWLHRGYKPADGCSTNTEDALSAAIKRSARGKYHNVQRSFMGPTAEIRAARPATLNTCLLIDSFVFPLFNAPRATGNSRYTLLAKCTDFFREIFSYVQGFRYLYVYFDIIPARFRCLASCGAFLCLARNVSL